MSKTHLRTTKFVLLIIALSITLAIPVFAYHFNNISWQQGSSSQIFIGEKDFNGPITFDGVATSPNEGYFKVELQNCYNILMPTITLSNITKNHKTHPVFSNINLTINQGDFLLITGESGSGKTTLLNLIGGIEQPTSGNIFFDNVNLNSLSKKARLNFYRHQIGFIFQGFYLQPHLTIAENISLVGLFSGIKKAIRQERTKIIAEYLKIPDILNRFPSQISGGQAERACIARAIFMNPKIILADEPTNNLDQSNIENFLQLLQSLWRETGTTIIMSSHNPTITSYATRIVHLANGTLTEQSPAS